MHDCSKRRRRIGCSCRGAASCHEANGDNVTVPQQTALLDAIVDNSGSAHVARRCRRHVVFLNLQATRMLEVGEADVGRPFHELSLSYRPVDLRSRIDEAYRQDGLSASRTRPITARPPIRSV